MKKNRFILEDEPKAFVVIQKGKPTINNDKKDAIKKAASDKKDANGKRD